ncbi:MAG: hypothetical protein ACREOQ_06870 [Gemmatimonadales bacterium]
MPRSPESRLLGRALTGLVVTAAVLAPLARRVGTQNPTETGLSTA